MPLERSLVGTSEVLIVRSGRCEMDVYDDDRALVTTRELVAGDVVVIFAGGHGFRMLEDTTFLEVKQGPYTGLRGEGAVLIRPREDATVMATPWT